MKMKMLPMNTGMAYRWKIDVCHKKGPLTIAVALITIDAAPDPRGAPSDRWIWVRSEGRPDDVIADCTRVDDDFRGPPGHEDCTDVGEDPDLTRFDAAVE